LKLQLTPVCAIVSKQTYKFSWNDLINSPHSCVFFIPFLNSNILSILSSKVKRLIKKNNFFAEPAMTKMERGPQCNVLNSKKYHTKNQAKSNHLRPEMGMGVYFCCWSRARNSEGN
jgi:hypothetical protein